MQSLFLEPKLTGQQAQLLADRDLLWQIYRSVGQATNIVFPQIVVENLRLFDNALSELGVKSEIYYAHKPNKSISIARELALLKSAKIDIASYGELKSALNAGFNGSRIEATGPKDSFFLAQLLLHKATINIDSLSELQKIINLKKKIGFEDQTQIFVRLAKPSGLNTEKDSRFGIPDNEIDSLFSELDKYRAEIRFKGFSYHQNSYTPSSRILALERTILLTLEALKKGLTPDSINIGGGFKINYIANRNQWQDYVSGVIAGILGTGKHLGWNKTGLGYWNENGKIRGSQNFMNFYQNEDQYEQLSSLLSQKSTKLGGTFASTLSEMMLSLCIEPGRSMLDQAGMTIAEIIDIKKSANGENILVMNINRSQLDSFEQEYMLDPILVKPLESKETETSDAFLAGNLCLGSDFISKRRVFFKSRPEVGDLLIFTNTASYLMDFAESNTLQQPIAPKIAVYKKEDKLFFTRDENYFSI